MRRIVAGWGWMCLLALALGVSAKAPEATVATVSDAGAVVRLPDDLPRVRASQAAPELFAGLARLVNQDDLQLLEVWMLPDDIVRSGRGERPQALGFRFLRHPLFGTDALDDATWARERMRYRRTLEEMLAPKPAPEVQDNLDKAYNSRLAEQSRYTVDRIGRMGVYRDDDTSLRYSAITAVTQGSGEARKTFAVRLCSATVRIGRRLFLVQATRTVADVDAVDGFAEDQAEFDRFVDRIIEMNR